MEDYISRREHEEYAKRMEEEHRRQNHRIGDLEKGMDQNNRLIVSVEKLALSMENMQKELREQGARLESLESRDGEMWRKVTSYVITAVIGIVVGYVFVQIGMA